MPAADAVAAPAPAPTAPVHYVPPDDPRYGTPWESKETASKTIGMRISMYWDGPEEWFEGTIMKADKNGRVHIKSVARTVLPTLNAHPLPSELMNVPSARPHSPVCPLPTLPVVFP